MGGESVDWIKLAQDRSLLTWCLTFWFRSAEYLLTSQKEPLTWSQYVLLDIDTFMLEVQNKITLELRCYLVGEVYRLRTEFHFK
jgi:hypothetical protein